MTKLIHYSRTPLLRIESRDQEPIPSFKPKGLWFSVEDGYGWREWCEQEEFNLQNLKIGTELRLLESAQVLKISSSTEVQEFTTLFSAIYKNGTYINWKRVSKDFDAIIIAPYILKCRLGRYFLWYYGWDCSSGCVWGGAAVEIIQPS